MSKCLCRSFLDAGINGFGVGLRGIFRWSLDHAINVLRDFRLAKVAYPAMLRTFVKEVLRGV